MKRLTSTWLVLAVLLSSVAVFANTSDKPITISDYESSISGHAQINPTPEAVSLADRELRETQAYHDGTFEGQLGYTGFDIGGFATRFTADAPVIIQGLTLYFQGDADVTAGYVGIFLDAAALSADLPPHPRVPGMQMQPGNLVLWIFQAPDGGLVQVDVVVPDVLVDGGDYYVVIWDDGGFLGIGNDLQMNYVDRQWVGIAGSGRHSVTPQVAMLPLQVTMVSQPHTSIRTSKDHTSRLAPLLLTLAL